MADRAFYWCAICDKTGMQNELFRGMPESFLFRCQLGHAFTYEQLQTSGARKIPLVVQEKPAPTDVQATFWVDPTVLSNFRQRFPNQQNATVNSILHELADGDVVIISGPAARKLKAKNIRSGEEMIANADENLRLTAENADLVNKLNFFSKMMKGAGMEEEAEV